ncbi:MAG TPA: hypothetical protein VM052_03110 [Candidatus Limnocylindrales bacterium]|nr:hypothetical protein [Candidatus Limnocylindrales bacterium]
MNERRLSPRASLMSFAATTVLSTAAAVGLFVLLDPRAQAFWAGRLGEAFAAIRALFGAR